MSWETQNPSKFDYKGEDGHLSDGFIVFHKASPYMQVCSNQVHYMSFTQRAWKKNVGCSSPTY